MPKELTAEQAAARLETADTLGIPLGPGQPPRSCVRSASARTGTDLRVYGALLAVLTELFTHPGVHYLSGLLRPTRAGAAGQRREHRVHARGLPALRTAAGTTGTACDDDGRDPARCRRLVLPVAARRWHDRRVAPCGSRSRPVLVVEASDALPADVRARRASPCAARRRDRRPRALNRRAAGAAGRRRAADRRRPGDRPARRRVHPGRRDPPDGDRLHPQRDRDAARRGRRRRLRIAHARCSPTAACSCTSAGKVTNARRGSTTASASTTFAFGSPELYAWLDGNRPSRSCRSTSSTHRGDRRQPAT